MSSELLELEISSLDLFALVLNEEIKGK